MTIEDVFYNLVQELGQNPDTAAFKKTPKAATTAFTRLTDGYRSNIDELIADDPEYCAIDNLIVVKNLEFFSMCQSHLLPFSGVCHVGYHPADRVLGVNKITTIVEHFSHRLQVQETLTREIAEYIQKAIAPKGVIVEIEAHHNCMMIMGVARQRTSLVTQCRLGIFLDPDHQMMFEQKIK